MFQPFDKEGLRVSPLKLKVHPSASFRMQPCRFIRDGILKPLRTMLDQFVYEGVLISDSSCHSISHCQQERWWNSHGRGLSRSQYAIGGNGKSIAISAYYISKIGGQRFYAKVDNRWAIINCTSQKIVPRFQPS